EDGGRGAGPPERRRGPAPAPEQAGRAEPGAAPRRRPPRRAVLAEIPRRAGPGGDLQLLAEGRRGRHEASEEQEAEQRGGDRARPPRRRARRPRHGRSARRARGETMVSPPSSTITWPVRKPAPSETLHATRSATSSTVPLRRTGVAAARLRAAASKSRPSPCSR